MHEKNALPPRTFFPPAPLHWPCIPHRLEQINWMTKGSACLNLCSCNVNNYPANPFICLNFPKHKRELPTHSSSLKGDKVAVTSSALSHSLERGTCRKGSLLWLAKRLPKGEEESRGRGAGGGRIPGRLKTWDWPTSISGCVCTPDCSLACFQNCS